MKYIFKKKGNVILIRVFDKIGNSFLKWFKRSPVLDRERIKNILVIRLDHLGDVLLSTAIPKIVKETFPYSRLIFLTSSWAAPLLENNPFVDEVLIYDAPWFSKGKYAVDKRSPGYFQLISILRARQIDVALGLRGDLRENVLMAFSRIKNRIGYGITGGGFLLTKELSYRAGVHETGHVLDLLKALGIAANTLVPRIYFTEQEAKLFDLKLASLHLLGNARWVGFQVGAGSEAKEWPRENVGAFFDAFAKSFKDHRIVLVGSDEEKAKEILMAHPQLLLINLVNQTSLRELCLLMKKFKCFIGHDSGPTHLAAALGVRTIFLYSGTNLFEQWRPLAEEATVLRKPVPCSPCALTVCNVPGHPCMSGIEPQEVVRHLQAWLT